MNLYDQITAWLYAPFEKPLDPWNWVLLAILAATVTYAWTRVLENVLES